MKKIIILFLFIFSLDKGFCQIENNKKTESNEKQGLQELKESINEVKHNQEKSEILIEKLDEKVGTSLSNMEGKFKLEIEKIDTKYNNYLIFGGLIIALVAFATNFFGRKLIKERVETLIEQTATLYAEKKTDKMLHDYLSNGRVERLVIDKGEPAILKVIADLENRGSKTIDGIKFRGEKIISSLQASSSEITNPAKSNSDYDIEQANREKRINEFFELAFNSRDAIVQIELYKNLLELNPSHAEALNNIGLSYNNAYNYDKAIEYLEKCIQLHPSFALPYVNLANSLNYLERLDEALLQVEKAISINPKLDASYSIKGNILTKRGKHVEAEKVFGEAVKLNPNSPEAHLNRGFFYEESGRYEESEADYIAAETLGYQNKAMLYNNFAVLYRRQKKYENAIFYLEKARQENPNFPNIDGTLALIYADQNDRENFYKYLIIALEKGCPAWNYLTDSGFDSYRHEAKLKTLLETYKKKNMA